jgi:hypothetical protein
MKHTLGDTSVQSDRKSGTTAQGRAFTQLVIGAVWSKGQKIRGIDPDFMRADECAARMIKAAYGSTSEYGWEIDHIQPVSAGGGDELDNLQPLHWENNRAKGDDTTEAWRCAKSHARALRRTPDEGRCICPYLLLIKWLGLI